MSALRNSGRLRAFFSKGVRFGKWGVILLKCLKQIRCGFLSSGATVEVSSII
jgi:hypothetical protein